MFKYILFSILFISTFCSCNMGTNESSIQNDEGTIQDLLEKRYQTLLAYSVDSTAFPRSYSFEKEAIKKVTSRDWTSGFFPGNLWYLFQLTGDNEFKIKAEKWTRLVEKEKFNDGTHDMGFKIYCSFGNALKIEEKPYYKELIVQSAETLITRYNEKVGCLRSWDFNADIWEFPVIIDNMMNLELLFEASMITGDNKYRNIAIQHANTTLKNHFRTNNSSVHVVVYDTISGEVIQKVTHQGINDESSWARGQAWAIYGYTMTYRYTKNESYLRQAEATAAFFLNHSKLREDGLPYWDFDDPAIPNAPRDVSAGTIVASALVELYEYTENKAYLEHSEKVIDALKSSEYVLNESLQAPFILHHSTGNWPKKDEMDEPIVYGDYYFLETLLRLLAI